MTAHCVISAIYQIGMAYAMGIMLAMVVSHLK